MHGLGELDASNIVFGVCDAGLEHQMVELPITCIASKINGLEQSLG
jgi:hypothetical protein